MSNRRKTRRPLLDMSKDTFIERRKRVRRKRISGNLRRRRSR